ncbi:MULTISPECIES: MurR/RpiR family transcriptional regulator [Microbacterium]|uniref:MurR/RpiR family transcriptional regulator n=1 Tax=Microbacterium TaxID=33882 RepID=UPI000CC444AE|nr:MULTISPECIES: MurR/RpiR family transcriptional regulator [Microbacterium]MCZ4302640.1 MurR/RpiR family transcriptional regulator [Microbacterium oxydans]PKQ36355.1 MAG: MurR/RpiR family transcriptional regulator [Actinobacteria bacterium HGW-Actinobacteria-11]QEA27914.1 MurR/RpiR family transcriptional regulator [Microbacterium sp. CBA3102]
MPNSVVTAIHQRRSGLTATEARISDHVLAHPQSVVDASITQLAVACGTSPASIARFAQRIGFVGYPELRLALAGELTRSASDRERFRVSGADVDRDDDATTTVRKVAFSEAAAIEQTARQIDVEELERCVSAIREARRIDIYGAASSGLAAMDLEQKLHRGGFWAQARTDLHLALTGAALLDDRDVAIAISHSGRTLEIVQSVETAARAGALTIAITNNPRSPLAQASALVLLTAVSESTFRSGAMASRIAQLTVLDFLFTRIVQAEYDRIADNLRLTFDAVTEHRID